MSMNKISACWYHHVLVFHYLSWPKDYDPLRAKGRGGAEWNVNPWLAKMVHVLYFKEINYSHDDFIINWHSGF